MANPTEPTAAEIFYAEFLLPLRMANRRARRHYLQLEMGPPDGATGYWRPIATRTGGYERVEAGRADVAGLLEALGDYWRLAGEERLLQLLPYLLELQAHLNSAGAVVEPAGETLPEFVYPMF